MDDNTKLILTFPIHPEIMNWMDENRKDFNSRLLFNDQQIPLIIIKYEPLSADLQKLQSIFIQIYFEQNGRIDIQEAIQWQALRAQNHLK